MSGIKLGIELRFEYIYSTFFYCFRWDFLENKFVAGEVLLLKEVVNNPNLNTIKNRWDEDKSVNKSISRMTNRIRQDKLT